MGGLPHHPVELSLLARVVIAGPTALQAGSAYEYAMLTGPVLTRRAFSLRGD